MARGKNRPAQRVLLPNGMWVLLYENGTIKIAGYDRDVEVFEVTNRGGTDQANTEGCAVFLRVKPRDGIEPRSPRPRDNDLVTIGHARARVLGALTG